MCECLVHDNVVCVVVVGCIYVWWWGWWLCPPTATTTTRPTNNREIATTRSCSHTTCLIFVYTNWICFCCWIFVVVVVVVVVGIAVLVGRRIRFQFFRHFSNLHLCSLYSKKRRIMTNKRRPTHTHADIILLMHWLNRIQNNFVSLFFLPLYVFFSSSPIACLFSFLFCATNSI